MSLLVVWKFPLEDVGSQQVEMPKGAKILSVGEQGRALVVWAACDPSQPREPRWFYIVGTGWDFGGFEENDFVGTVQSMTGLVWHVWVEREVPR